MVLHFTVQYRVVNVVGVSLQYFAYFGYRLMRPKLQRGLIEKLHHILLMFRRNLIMPKFMQSSMMNYRSAFYNISRIHATLGEVQD